MSEEYRGFITYCFSDWEADSFKRAPMKIRDGERSEVPQHGSLEGLVEGEDYYLKPDPDFDELTYGICHRKLREKIQPGDYLFFRTNHRDQQFIIGYFRVADKVEGDRGPVLIADPERSRCIDFDFKLSEDNWDVVETLNPRAKGRYDSERADSRNMMALGRNYLILDQEKTDYLLGLLQD